MHPTPNCSDLSMKITRQSNKSMSWLQSTKNVSAQSGMCSCGRVSLIRLCGPDLAPQVSPRLALLTAFRVSTQDSYCRTPGKNPAFHHRTFNTLDVSKPALLLAAVVLAGCASTGTWRDLQIDGSSQSSINKSVFLIRQELPTYRRERFDMVLSDLWTTGTLKSEAEGNDYTTNDFFAQLDGLRYEDVLDLAGPDTTPRYWAVVQARGRAGVQSANNRPWPGTDPNRFPPPLVVPPAIAAMSP